MSLSDTEAIEVAAKTAAAAQKETATVGFDGSEGSRRALASPEPLVTGRAGRIEVGCVARPTASQSISGVVEWEMENTFGEIVDR
jgi:hypothetical protein